MQQVNPLGSDVGYCSSAHIEQKCKMLMSEICLSFISVIRSWSSADSNIVFRDGRTGKNRDAKSNKRVKVAVREKPVWCENWFILLQQLVGEEWLTLHCVGLQRQELVVQFLKFTVSLCCSLRLLLASTAASSQARSSSLLASEAAAVLVASTHRFLQQYSKQQWSDFL